MKIQMQGQALRLRIDEAELATLFDQGWIENLTWLSHEAACCQRIEIADAELALQGDATAWCLRIPRQQLADYVARLPCRDGLEWNLPIGSRRSVQVSFEVDVRDSVRKRGASRRTQPTTGENRG
ncbi:hypothetical protein [Dokdonella sp.]|uniref:hypothetical protein n=1 Tax=Dokdonella sp. TaxID=2291710 RepID=UPI0025BECA63|nr:hypothetical protein [Dokdonella sp.]MBX3689229.1 hypothetical protein [Dokdonella sp.]